MAVAQEDPRGEGATEDSTGRGQKLLTAHAAVLSSLSSPRLPGTMPFSSSCGCKLLQIAVKGKREKKVSHQFETRHGPRMGRTGRLR